MENWYRKSKEDVVFPDYENYWQPVSSSFIQSVAYDPESLVLEVMINSGKKYTLTNILPELYKDFMDSESKGAFFNNVLKPYKK